MKGDFSRNTFDPRKRYSRVLMQQGRVQLDADWNEQGAIFTHYLRALAADLIGPHGGPGDSFKVHALTNARGHPIPNDFSIQAGHYYVDGILCENEEAAAYTQQPAFPFPGVPPLQVGNTYVVYLDVWERHVSYVEDTHIREVALGGADTATRAQVVWQVKVLPFEFGPAPDEVADRRARLQAELRELMGRLEEALEAGDQAAREELQARIEALSEELQSLETGAGIIRLNSPSAARVIRAKRMHLSNARLRARASHHASSADSDVILPDAGGYSGAENRLYRVEVHAGSKGAQRPTVKWSRENGSVVFPIATLRGNTAALAHLGRGHRHAIEPGDWVEIVDDEGALRGQPGPLVQVERVDRQRMTVVFARRPGRDYDEHSDNHPLLRRWDQRPEDAAGDGNMSIVEGESEEDWTTLEDGIQIQFQPGGQYRSGDYWCIPARTATADIEWPGSASGPEAMPPQGVEHHYAPLAIISIAEGGSVQGLVDCRRVIERLGKPVRGEQNAWGHPEIGFA
jgi:hypothetical protein